jgi:hypothetical protein
MRSIQAVAELASSGLFEHTSEAQARDQPFQLDRRKGRGQPFVALTSSVDGRDLGEALASR